MGDVLLRAFCFVFLIFLGFILKRVGLFKQGEYRVISKVVLNITLPAAVITSFATYDSPPSLLILVVIGFACNLLMFGVGYITSRGKPAGERAFRMLNYPGYNIGCFTLPFVQSFLGPLGVIATCMFDTGNSMMCMGGSYALTSTILGVGERGTAKGFLKKCVSSVPLDTYVIMLLVSLAKVPVPNAVVTLTSLIGGANGVLAMLMIGMMFEIHFEKAYFKQAAVTLGVRYGFAAVLAALFYFATPFPLVVRQVLAIVVFAPITSVTPVYTEQCGGDGALASFTNSVAILLSVAIITGLLLAMGIG
ncbi:AEC family transporter [Feifania hominis]|uniref:AEC family transporter n=1 Tax=Feifania hominis TaxID=2763660 RepID=A0A926DCP8_9FIRM|nr:AEC family transporter [Feifania hominis]MBC8535406.1 AEC family transporter [Feifania hominis]